MLLRIAFALALPYCLVSPALCQERATTHERTATPSTGRFEIVASTIAARYTMRVDKFTGNTDLLVLNTDSTLTWQPMSREPHPQGDVVVPGRANFQVFTSGVAARYTFLLNVNTGATWQLVTSKDGDLSWQAMH